MAGPNEKGNYQVAGKDGTKFTTGPAQDPKYPSGSRFFNIHSDDMHVTLIGDNKGRTIDVKKKP